MSSKEEKEEGAKTSNVEEKKTEEENVEKKIEPPHGIFVKWVSDKNAEKLGLKSGSDIRDLVPYKLFKVSFVRDHAQKFGHFSEFEDFMPYLNASEDYKANNVDAKKEGGDEEAEEEEVLVSSDLNKTYGEYWHFHYTKASKDAFFKRLKDKEEEEERAKREAEAAEAERRRKEEAERNAVWEPKQFVPSKRSKDDVSDAETVAEMAFVCSRPTRRLLKLRARTSRSTLKQKYTFTDAGSSGSVGFRSKLDPNFELRRKELDLGLQAGPSLFANHSDASTQTTANTKRNASTTYTPQTRSRDARTLLTPSFVNFLDDACFEAERALQQNETVDMFMDDMRSIRPDVTLALGNENEATMTPLRTFIHLLYSKDKRLSSVDWHPTRPGVVLVTCVENITFDVRCDIDGQARDAFNLIWNFRDLLQPEKILRSPFETTRCKFNPSDPDIVVGGLLSGQVILWKVANDKGRDDDANSGGSEEGANDEIVSHARLSAIDHSHGAAVTDLQWMPSGMEVDPRGRVVRNANGRTTQFITTSLDGQILFWDVRDGASTASTFDKDAASTAWRPVFKTTLRGSGGKQHKKLKTASLTRFLLDMEHATETKRATTSSSSSSSSSARNSESSSSRKERSRTLTTFCATNEEGQLVYADWNLGKSGRSGLLSRDSTVSATDAEVTNETNACMIQSVHSDHVRPAVGLYRSPFYDDIVLSLSDYTFNIWKDGVSKPIFMSPVASSPIRCGLWSRSRPGALLVGKGSGEIDIWDFTVASHKPRAAIQVGTSAIVSMQMRASNSKVASESARDARGASKDSEKGDGERDGTRTGGDAARSGELLAVGDAAGSLQIFEVPSYLSKRSTGELEAVREYFDREEMQTMYCIRHESTTTPASTKLSVEAPTKTETVPVVEASSPTTKKDRSSKTKTSSSADALKAAEKEYQKIERKYRALFGVKKGGDKRVRESKMGK